MRDYVAEQVTGRSACCFLSGGYSSKWTSGVCWVLLCGSQQQIQKLVFQACPLGKSYNIRTTTWKSLEEIKVSFAKHGVEIASHPHTTRIEQPALSKGTFFLLLFWINIIMQMSRWNYDKSVNLIDLGLVWQVHIVPKCTLFGVCLMWWGNPSKASDLVSL